MLLDLNKVPEVYIVCGYTDLRKSIDGLLILIQESFSISDMRNKIFMFSNKHKNRLKIIEIDIGKIWLYQKRLTKDKFRWPKVEYGKFPLSKDELNYLLTGMDITQIHLPIDIKYTY